MLAAALFGTIAPGASTTKMEDMIAFGRKILASQAFSRLLGTEITHLEAGTVELRLALKPELQQQHGFAHGGVLAYLADNALTFAGGTSMGADVVTSEMKINYVRPALGHTLIARAHTVSAGKTQAVARCDLFVVSESGETLCAAAQGTIVALRPKPEED